MSAANAAALNIASLLEEPMWDDLEGKLKCSVKCNGKVSYVCFVRLICIMNSEPAFHGKGAFLRGLHTSTWI